MGGEWGWEYNAVLIGAVTALAETGPGDLSLDHALGVERRGSAWAIASLASGAATAALTMLAGSRGKAGTAIVEHGEAASAAHGDTAGDPTTTGT